MDCATATGQWHRQYGDQHHTNAVRSFTIRNANAGSPASILQYFGNNTSASEGSIILNSSANVGGNGANSLTMNNAAGIWLQFNGTNSIETTASGGVTMPNLTNANTGDYVCFNAGVIEYDATACAAGIFANTQAVTNTLTIATATFTPVLTAGINQQMTLIHGSCPCTIANPTGIASAVGQTGMFDIIQSSSGSETIGTWGSQYITPGGISSLMLSTGANVIDHIPYRVINSTHILLGPVMQNATH